MRSLKKLLAVLLALTMMLSIMVVPAFAAESLKYEDEAKVLYDLDLFRGKSTTEFVPDLESRLERQDGVALVLRLFNLDTEAEKMSESEAKALLAEKFADADKVAAWAVKYVAYAVKNGIVDGRPDGNFAPNDPLLGKEFAKMILAELGQYDPANFQTSCADLAAISDLSAAEAIRFNDKILIRDDVVGISFSSLAAEYADGGTVLSRLAAANAELKAKAIELGLISIVKVNTEIEPIVIKVGEAVELPAKVEVEYADGSVAEVAVTWDKSAVKADVAGEYKAVGTVEAFDGTIEVAVTVTPDVLAVESVSADNLKEIVVVFNQDISENAEAAKKDNYKINVDKIASVKVDGNTAILSLDKKADNQKAATLTITNKILEAEEKFDFTFFDATLPEVVDIEITGPKSINVNFTEPVEAGNGKVTLKTGSSTLSVNTNFEFNGSTVKVPLYSTLADGKSYTITISEFTDYAGYKNVIKTIEFVYEKDETPPVATVVEATQEYVKVSFNKPVSGLTTEHFSHTFTAWTAMSLTTKDSYADATETDAAKKATVVDSKKSVDTVYVWFYKDGKSPGVERAIPEGETSFRIRTKANYNNADYEIKDEWGNKLEELNTTISVTADKSALEIAGISVTAEDEIKVKFNKNVREFDKDNIEVLDADGNKIDGVKLTISGSGKEFNVKLGKKLAGKSILVNIKNVEDTTLSSNKLASYSEVIEITDKTAPEITNIAYEADKDDAKKGYLYVFYNEQVDNDTALKVSNYFIYDNGAYTKLTGDISFFNGEKIVKIALTEAQFTKVKAAMNIFVTGVKDLAGNEIAPKVNVVKGTLQVANTPAIDYIDADNTAKGLKVYATATDKIEVTFNQELTNVEAKAFSVFVGATEYDVVGMDVELSSGKTKAILTVEKVVGDTVNKLPYSVTEAGNEVKVVLNKEKIENAFGTKNDVATSYTLKTINDKIAPALDTIAQEANSNDYITLTFKEDVFYTVGEDLAATDIKIINQSDDDKELVAGKDFTIDGTKSAGKVISIKLVKTGLVGSKLKVTTNDNRQYIVDANGNKLAAIDKTVEVKDVIAPVFDKIEVSADKKVVTVSFNEKIENALADDAALKAAVTFAADGATFAALGADDTVEIKDGKLVITFNVAIDADADDTIKVAKDALKDAAGNKTAEVTETVVAPV